MLSLEGKQLGNYDVIRRIRVGGMGAVYEGSQRTAFDRRVAIKVILGDYATDPDMRRRFAREARTVARLHHPHILPLIEFGDEQGILYLVMPFIEGGTLTSYLRRSLPDLSEVAAIYQQLLDAVEYAHDEGLIHRDIKSSNVLLEQRRSGPPYVYLADFGLVRTSQQAEQEQAGKPIPLDKVPGTPHYMAPEQTRGIVTTLTDIYAMGVLLYQMLTGELPYNDPDDIRVIQMHLYDAIPSPCDHDASIPAELGDVVRKAMAKKPEERYKNIAELRTAFLAAVKGPIAPLQDDEPPIFIGQHYTPPKRPTAPMSLPLPKQQQQEPILRQTEPAPRRPVSISLEPKVLPVRVGVQAPAQRRVRNAPPVPIGGGGVRERPRVTETVKNNKPRITEEPVKWRRKRFVGLILATMIVPVILLLLLIMPRVLGFSFFPSGFPVFGISPVATVFVTAQSKILQDKYVLTASTSIKAPDLKTHTIPARLVTGHATDSLTVSTTGVNTVAGVQAHGSILFINNSHQPIAIPAQFQLTNVAGVQIQVTQAVLVPPHQHGQDGMATVPAIVVNPGVVGNIAAHTVDGQCCDNGLAAQNPDPFTSGVDAQTLHMVTQADLDGAKNTLSPKLQALVMQQLSKQLVTDEAPLGQTNYTVNVSSDNPVGAQADQVKVTIQVNGSGVTYNTNVASHTAAQLLTTDAAEKLGSAYQLQGTPSIASPRVVESDKPGLVYVSVSVHGLWLYTLSPDSLNQWRQAIKGETSAVALAYLNNQPGVAAVQIQLPLGADHLPPSGNDIQVILVSS